MTDDKTHPFTVFLHETADGKIAYNPPSEEDSGRHWVFNWENKGFNFNFVVHERDGVLGYEIYAKDIQWVGRFLYGREIEYVDEPIEQVQELVSESVEIREEPLDVGEMETYCSSCHTHYDVSVMPKMDLVIEGSPAQRIFVETCPECGEDLVEKKTGEVGGEDGYPGDVSDLHESQVWEHSRRTP